jgi:hypothetical protein
MLIDMSALNATNGVINKQWLTAHKSTLENITHSMEDLRHFLLKIICAATYNS